MNGDIHIHTGVTVEFPETVTGAEYKLLHDRYASLDSINTALHESLKLLVLARLAGIEIPEQVWGTAEQALALSALHSSLAAVAEPEVVPKVPETGRGLRLVGTRTPALRPVPDPPEGEAS